MEPELVRRSGRAASNTATQPPPIAEATPHKAEARWTRQDVLQSVHHGVVAVGCGVAFGVAMARSLVYLPSVIIDQLVFRRWIMMKMFLAAMGTGSAVFSALHLLMPEAMAAVRNKANSRGVVVVVCGSLLLGVGMAVGGACPGTLYVQAGAAISSVPYAFAGAILGVFAYSPLQSFFQSYYQVASLKYLRLDEALGRSPSSVNVIMALICWGAALLIEYFVPWREDLPFDCAMCWPPLLSGAIIGGLQLITSTQLQTYLGASSSYFIAVCLIRAMHPFQYLPGLRSVYRSEKLQLCCGNYCEGCFHMGKIWQLPFVVGAVFGSYMSRFVLDSAPEAILLGTSSTQALVGGFCIVFGARLAGGCTSGNGISGGSLLAIPSLFAICGMFSGAIGTAVYLGM